jgi:hypothetical protein
MTDAAQLRSIAVEARRVLEQGGWSLAGLATFPRGACTSATNLLGQYLKDRGLGTWTRRSGMRTVGGGCATHAWLELDGLVVDLTADQFADGLEPVLVSRDSDWHLGWDPIGHGGADMSNYTPDAIAGDGLADYHRFARLLDDAVERLADSVRTTEHP